ncbi:hypothetical protein N9L92_01770 [Saprospiraceae bacterium]|nr:hypothetical protein [Saprospiraceae bacterium]
MKKIFQIILISIIVCNCNSKQEFNSKEWNKKSVDWWMTDIREKMVDDLIFSDTLIKLSKIEVIKLLGQPENNSSFELKYLIREKYGFDIDPKYITMLIIKFDEKGKVIKCEIEK